LQIRHELVVNVLRHNVLNNIVHVFRTGSIVMVVVVAVVVGTMTKIGTTYSARNYLLEEGISMHFVKERS